MKKGCRSINAELAKKILERDNYTCAYCGGHGWHIDHVVPYSKGGPTRKWNLVCVCQKCNGKKSNRIELNTITKGLFWLAQHGEDISWTDEIEF